MAFSLRGLTAYIKASNPGVDDDFGNSITLSGDTLAVGAPAEDSGATGIDGNQNDNSTLNGGAVYVFHRSGSTWTQQAYLKPDRTRALSDFGYGVALSGDTLAVGEPGDGFNPHMVYIFQRTGPTWTQQAALTFATGIRSRFNPWPALSGDTLAVGLPDYAVGSGEKGGAVLVYQRTGLLWTQQAVLTASNLAAGDHFGSSVALAGDTLAAAAPDESSGASGVDGDQADNSVRGSGAVYVFQRTGTTWTQQAYVKASNPSVDAGFGFSMSLTDDTLAVGAIREDGNATGVDGDPRPNTAYESGAVYVYRRSGPVWTPQAYIKASNAEPNHYFGFSVTLAGDLLAVGAPGENSGAIGLGGDQTDKSARQSGAVYLFQYTGTTWAQRAYVKSSNSERGDGFGHSVALSGKTLAVSASEEDSGATGIDGNQADNSVEGSGAVYVFQ